ncbi:MAG: accessory gene regulator B family protein [Bacillus sp. (in: firmicutes)]
MIERYAVVLAGKIKKWNPEETAPQDVLIFGFTIMLNLFSTMLLLFVAGFIIGKPFEVVAIAVSFMVMRLLTGGPHFNNAIVCSLCSTLLMIVGDYLPITYKTLIFYTIAAVFLFVRYAPFYEPDQVVHTKSWERKKKNLAFCLLGFSSLLAFVFHFHVFLIGVFLQSVTIIPFVIKCIHRLNDGLKGGEKYEKSDC